MKYLVFTIMITYFVVYLYGSLSVLCSKYARLGDEPGVLFLQICTEELTIRIFINLSLKYSQDQQCINIVLTYECINIDGGPETVHGNLLM